MKFPASQEVKRNKSPCAAAYFTAKLFPMPQAYFKNPAGIYFIEKSTPFACFFLAEMERLEKAAPFRLLRKQPIVCPCASAVPAAHMDESFESLTYDTQ